MDMTYFYSSDKVLSEAERVEKNKLENQLCNLINIIEIGIHNSSRTQSISVKKEKDYIFISIKADGAEIAKMDE